jgi:hypothetical protein
MVVCPAFRVYDNLAFGHFCLGTTHTETDPYDLYHSLKVIPNYFWFKTLGGDAHSIDINLHIVVESVLEGNVFNINNKQNRTQYPPL